MHPLVRNLETLSDSEVEEKIFKLNRAYHMSHNQEVRHQIIITLDTYKIELEERLAKKKVQEMNDQGESGLDNLINIS
tara:strand:+ start:880 stop:1113 length:234 start_codon:yes stop_codon:yes gene_type:complete